MKNIIDPLALRKNFISARQGADYRHLIKANSRFFVLKRISDILISSLFIIFVLSWLIPIVAFCIKVSSKGPVFFAQKRTGKGGKPFMCLKFRTMILNKDADTKQATENDRRITKLGNFLRKTNIDELPQFINVLTGEMSLIGPRPHMLADCNMFSEAIPGYKLRNFVKPGITGLAQSKGYKGATSNFESMFRRYQYDIFYVRNASFLLDLSIIRHTIRQQVSSSPKPNKPRKFFRKREPVAPVREIAA